MSGPTVKTFVDAVSPLVTLFRYGQVPSGQAMPYADYLPKLTTTDSADDRACVRHLRYDLRVYQPMDGQDDALIASILDALDAVAAETGTSSATVAIAWIAAQPGITAPIASATSLRQLDSLIAAGQLALTEAQVRHLTEASA